MPLISRLSLETLLKNFFGVRGPYGPALEEVVMPVFDVGVADVVNDDGSLYYATVLVQAAVAAQFSFAYLGPMQGRMSVDYVILNPAAAVSTVRIQKLAAAPTPLTTQVALRQASGGATTTGAALSVVGSQVADPGVAGQGVGRVQLPAANAVPFNAPIAVGLRAGETLLFSPTAVNTSIDVTVYGRLFPSFPE